jgi:hypothetical protein
MLKDGGDFIAKVDQSGLDSGAGLQLLPTVGDGVGIPINVLGGQAGRVGLPCASVLEQFVKVVALGIQLSRDDGLMFGAGDGALLLEQRPGPLQARDDGFKEPLDAEGLVVDAP